MFTSVFAMRTAMEAWKQVLTLTVPYLQRLAAYAVEDGQEASLRRATMQRCM